MELISINALLDAIRTYALEMLNALFDAINTYSREIFYVIFLIFSCVATPLTLDYKNKLVSTPSPYTLGLVQNVYTILLSIGIFWLVFLLADLIGELRRPISTLGDIRHRLSPPLTLIEDIQRQITRLRSTGRLTGASPSWQVERYVSRWSDEILETVHSQYRSEPLKSLVWLFIRSLGLILILFLMTIQLTGLLGVMAFRDLTVGTDSLTFLRGTISQIFLVESNFGTPLHFYTQLLSIAELLSGTLLLTVIVNMLIEIIYERRTQYISAVRDYINTLLC